MKRVVRDRVRQRVIVTLKSGGAFSGVLWDWDREAFVLRAAAQLVEGAAPISADGELVFLASDVDYLQFP